MSRNIVDNALTDDFQSAYKCGHSTETALLRVSMAILLSRGCQGVVKFKSPIAHTEPILKTMD